MNKTQQDHRKTSALCEWLGMLAGVMDRTLSWAAIGHIMRQVEPESMTKIYAWERHWPQ
jgi:hypothetical protein